MSGDFIGPKVIAAYTGNAAFNTLWQGRMAEATEAGLSFLLAEDFIDWVLSETWRRFCLAEPESFVRDARVSADAACAWLEKWNPAT